MSVVTEIRCRWNGTESPRVVLGRHVDECEGDCGGCLPCPLDHCLGCYRTHNEHVCPDCLADVRETLTEIGRLCDGLPAEAERKGVDSEAFNLMAPAADPEALGHMQASVNVGRIPADWLESADHELHPLIVVGGWMEAYLEAFSHDEPARITVSGALSYLTRNLDHIGTEDDIPFRDFRRDLADCRTHLERVLHDGEQIETGAPCMTCERPLLRVFGGGELPWSHRDGSRPLAGEDCWACARCREWRGEDDYRLNVRQVYVEEAEKLPLTDLALRLDVDMKDLRRLCAPVRVSVGGEIIEQPPRLKPAGKFSGRKVYRVSEVKELLRSA